MRGYVHIYVDKKTGKISLLKGHKTNVGYGQSMGYLIPTNRKSLKKDILICMEDSLSAYQQKVEVTDPFKASPYKTWNKFFKYRELQEQVEQQVN